jgi:hypothetical protein
VDEEESPPQVPPYARFDRSWLVTKLVDDLVVGKKSSLRILLPQEDDGCQCDLVFRRKSGTLHELRGYECTDLRSTVPTDRPLGLGRPQPAKGLDGRGIKISQSGQADRQGRWVDNTLGEHRLKLVRCHRHCALTGPHEVAATERERLPERPRTDAHNDYAPFRELEFRDVDTLAQLAGQLVHLRGVVSKRIRPNNGARYRVIDP